MAYSSNLSLSVLKEIVLNVSFEEGAPQGALSVVVASGYAPEGVPGGGLGSARAPCPGPALGAEGIGETLMGRFPCPFRGRRGAGCDVLQQGLRALGGPTL